MRITGILGGLLLAAAATAASPAAAQPAPDLARARDLYKAAEAEMAAGRYADAASDYGAVYDITRDPVVFYKIGSANEQAGRCDVALVYYARYLKEARPSEKFAAQTAERITACGGGPPAAATATGPGAASAPTAAASAPTAAAPPGPAAIVDTAPAPAAAPVGPPPTRPGHHKAAWLCVSGAVAFVTLGAVFAYSAHAAENDVADLYVGFDGKPPAYDDHTRGQYEALQRDGRRYEVLSWMSFGVAGVAAVAAASLFYGDRHERAPRTVIAPTIAPGGGGVAATIRF